MKVKICGITNKEDALNAVSLGADAIGFIFYKDSPRYIDPDLVEEITLFLPPYVSTVGVFVDHDYDFIVDTVKQCRLDVIQLHGSESPEFCMKFPERVVKAVHVAERSDLDTIYKYQGCASAILLDTKMLGVPGGTGKTFDWGLALEAEENDIPIILSGGINVDNVNKAIRLINPYAIDLCSGVEKEPGIKDYNKMEALIKIAKSI